MALRRIELLLDDDDFDTIEAEIARYQARNRWHDDEGGTLLPEGESNLPGAILAELLRELGECREIRDKGFEAGS
jgi:hypothetical protein